MLAVSGSPIVRGNCEAVHAIPQMFRRVFDSFRQLGKTFGETGQFAERLVRKLAQPERFSKALALFFQLFYKSKMARSYWDDQLKENGAYEQRFARPYAE